MCQLCYYKTINSNIMKKSILSMVVVALMTGTISTSYGQNRDQKPYSERENVREVNRNKADSKQNYQDDQKKSAFEFQNFRKECQGKIRNNEKRISALKVKFSKFNSREKSEYRRNLQSLERKNDKLKRKLSNYNEKQQDKWMSFKRDFNHDLDEVSDALKDFSMDHRNKRDNRNTK